LSLGELQDASETTLKKEEKVHAHVIGKRRVAWH
jgi:hypothetical protein